MTLKEKIVDAAYELFGEKGYEKTSVAEIIDRAGASKGGFYHHFKSKEGILETISFNYVDQIRKHYDELLKDDKLSVVEKFMESFYRLNSLKVGAVKDWDKIKNLYTFKDNHIVLMRMGNRFERETSRYYHRLIEQGVEEGIFQVVYPAELAALWGREVILFQQMARKALMDPAKGEAVFFRTLQFNEHLINQQLGFGSKVIELEPMGRAYLAAMKREMKGGSL
jgi:AcrR family transcriptional regulator